VHGSLDAVKEFLIDNLLVRIHLIIVIIWWTGLAPWELEISFSGSLKTTPLTGAETLGGGRGLPVVRP
jgi:hypothetical protein